MVPRWSPVGRNRRARGKHGRLAPRAIGPGSRSGGAQAGIATYWTGAMFVVTLFCASVVSGRTHSDPDVRSSRFELPRGTEAAASVGSMVARFQIPPGWPDLREDERADLVCRAFEDAWRSGEDQRIEEYLDAA